MSRKKVRATRPRNSLEPWPRQRIIHPAPNSPVRDMQAVKPSRIRACLLKPPLSGSGALPSFSLRPRPMHRETRSSPASMSPLPSQRWDRRCMEDGKLHCQIRYAEDGQGRAVTLEGGTVRNPEGNGPQQTEGDDADRGHLDDQGKEGVHLAEERVLSEKQHDHQGQECAGFEKEPFPDRGRRNGGTAWPRWFPVRPGSARAGRGTPPGRVPSMRAGPCSAAGPDRPRPVEWTPFWMVLAAYRMRSAWPVVSSAYDWSITRLPDTGKGAFCQAGSRRFLESV